MIPNVNSQKMYAPPSLMPPAIAQDLTTGQYVYNAPVNNGINALTSETMPVYNGIPYNPYYGNMIQPQRQASSYSPKISTVSIEMNGLEPPKVPGCNDFQAQPAPYYPGMSQLSQPTVPYYSYNGIPQPQYMPQYIPQPVGMQPLPEAIPPSAVVGAIPPAPQYPQPPQQEITQKQEPIATAPQTNAQAPQAAAQTPQATAPVNEQQDKEAVKPLLDALDIISPKQGVPEPTMEQQEKAIQTIAQFARVTEASDKLAITDSGNPEVIKTKEKVDNIIKPNLIKEDTFLGLADIAIKDTSKLSAEDKKKADQNRITGMWTLAMLQKLFKQEINQEAKKINIPPISMNEVPGIVQIIDIVKKDPNPEVSEAGIAALVNLADPQDKKDAETMRAILSESLKNGSENVKNSAAEAMKLYPEETSK